VLFVPIAVVTVPLAGDLFDEEHGWGQWAYFFAFFVLGHVVMSEPRLLEGVRRDVMPAFALAVGGLVGVFALDAPGFFETWDGDVRDPRAVVLLVLIAAQAWGWVLALWGWACGCRPSGGPCHGTSATPPCRSSCCTSR
jgi:hypothetical protein